MLKWIKSRLYFIKKPYRIYSWTHNEKKYLVIARHGWRGVKWKRYFEVKDELDSNYKPIPFKGDEAVRPYTK